MLQNRSDRSVERPRYSRRAPPSLSVNVNASNRSYNGEWWGGTKESSRSAYSEQYNNGPREHDSSNDKNEAPAQLLDFEHIQSRTEPLDRPTYENDSSDDSDQPNSDSDAGSNSSCSTPSSTPPPSPYAAKHPRLWPGSPPNGTVEEISKDGQVVGQCCPCCPPPATSVTLTSSYLDRYQPVENCILSDDIDKEPEDEAEFKPYFQPDFEIESDEDSCIESDTESFTEIHTKSDPSRDTNGHLQIRTKFDGIFHDPYLDTTPLSPPPPYQLRDPRSQIVETEEEVFIMRRYVSWSCFFGFTNRRHIVSIIIGVLSAAISATVLPLSTVLLGFVFGEFALYGQGISTAAELLPRITVWIRYYVILAGGGWAAYGIFYCAWIWLGEMQAESARKVVYQALMGKELEWFDTTEHEILKVANRCHTQIREFQLAVSQPLGLLIQAIITALGCLAVAFYFSWHLTLVCLAGMPVATIVVSFFSNGIDHGIDQQSLALGSAAQSISRAVKGIDTVKYFNGQDMEISLYKTAIQAAGLAYNRIAKYAALQNAILRFLTLMVFVQGFWYASTLVNNGTKFEEISGYMTALWACLIAGQQIETVFPLLILLEKGKVAASDLRRLTMQDVEYEISKRPGLTPRKCNGFVVFNDVKFTYPSRKDVASLNGLSMFVNAGDTCFIVGKSGCGKSTLANLLLTVWKHNTGTIYIDENPLEKLDRKWIHDNVTYVPQRPALFNESISRNIRFGTPDTDNLTMKDLWHCCDDVFLTEVISGLPQGLRTKLQPGGTNLSSGQRQRVSLARARLRDTPIMILDEPTSGLDEATQVLVMNILREWRRNKTTIIITHNLSDIRPNDFVYVMDAGRVVQIGHRKELELQSKGPFADLLRQEDVTYGDSAASSPVSYYGESIFDCYMYNDKENKCSNRLTKQPCVEPTLNALRKSTAHPLGKSLNPAHRVTFAPNHRNTLLLPRPITQNLQSNPKRIVSQRRKRPRRTRQSMEEVPPKPECKSTMMKGSHGLRHIFSTIGPHTMWQEKLCIISGIICCIISATSTPGFSYALAQLVNVFFTDAANTWRLMFWAIIVASIAAIDSCSSALQLYLFEYSAQRWIDSVRIRAYGLVMSQARSWFDVDRNQISRIAQDLEGNAEEMRNLLGRYLGFAINALVILAIGVGWSFTLNVELTAVGLIAAPVLFMVLRLFTYVSERYEEKCNSEAEELGVFLRDVLDNLVAVRTLSLKEYFDHKHMRLLKSSRSAGRKRAILTGLTVGLSDTGVFLATALLFWYGARLITTKSLPLSSALTIFAMLLFSLSNSAATLRIIPQVSASKDYARRVLRLLELKSISHENQGSRKIDLDGSLIVRNVSFSYPSRRRNVVLRNISLQVNPGEVIAIVGASGAGKSTLLSLIERLYSPNEGEVVFSGYKSSDLDIGHLRRQVAIVPQRPYLFPASVRENILYGSNNYNNDYAKSSGSMGGEKGPQFQQIVNAANAAGLGEWIAGLKDGYDTLLAMGDDSLSGGQLQKIAIARALVREPRVLLMDEATLGLDAASAATVMDTIWRLKHQGVRGGGMRGGQRWLW